MPVRMAAIQKSTSSKLLERVQRKGNPLTLLVEMQTSIATMEDNVEIPLKKMEIDLPYNPAIPLLGIHTKETRMKETHVPPLQHILQ